MEALPLARVKAFLVEHEVSFSDCFERSELLARYAEVKRRIDALEEQRLRALANRCSQRKSYELAVRYYSDALRVPASSTLHAQLYANRSAAYLSLGMCRAAMEDGQRAVDLDPTYIKGFLRLGYGAMLFAASPFSRAEPQDPSRTTLHFSRPHAVPFRDFLNAQFRRAGNWARRGGCEDFSGRPRTRGQCRRAERGMAHDPLGEARASADLGSRRALCLAGRRSRAA